jgi:hypothetical protein
MLKVFNLTSFPIVCPGKTSLVSRKNQGRFLVKNHCLHEQVVDCNQNMNIDQILGIVRSELFLMLGLTNNQRLSPLMLCDLRQFKCTFIDVALDVRQA